MLIFVLKIILYIVVFLTCTYIGILKSKNYILRESELKQFKEALNVFKAKVKFTYEPIPEVFAQIASCLKNNVGEVFKNASIFMSEMYADDAWKEAISKTNKTSINNEDKETLLKLGKLLGQTDLEGQINEIELVENFLNRQIEKAENARNKNEKLNRTLGMIAGITLVILLF